MLLSCGYAPVVSFFFFSLGHVMSRWLLFVGGAPALKTPCLTSGGERGLSSHSHLLLLADGARIAAPWGLAGLARLGLLLSLWRLSC